MCKKKEAKFNSFVDDRRHAIAGQQISFSPDYTTKEKPEVRAYFIVALLCSLSYGAWQSVAFSCTIHLLK
jgi:hypothetical protein